MNAVWWLALVLTASAGGKKDSDGDGVIDQEDLCKNAPEDADGFEDEDGCPEVDNDRDGIIDEMDQCPNEPEDADGFQDKDGCPDADPEPAPGEEGIAKKPLDALKQLEVALAAADAAAVKEVFDPKGWGENLIGTSGATGEEFAKEALAEGWLVKPTEASLEEMGDRAMIWCKLVRRSDGVELDAVYLVLAKVDGSWKLLGGGEDEFQARDLAEKTDK